MVTDAAKMALGLTGTAAVCAEMINSPVMIAATQVVIVTTCVVVMAHILIGCFKANRKGKRKQEARRGRADKTDAT